MAKIVIFKTSEATISDKDPTLCGDCCYLADDCYGYVCSFFKTRLDHIDNHDFKRCEDCLKCQSLDNIPNDEGDELGDKFKPSDATIKKMGILLNNLDKLRKQKEGGS
jgi:hypothetical protein